MKTKAIRIHGEMDIRLEEIELPEIGKGEALIKVVSDSVCLSTYKAVKQGASHKRVPNDIAENPIIIGHEMCAEIIELGDDLKGEWKVG
jgi:threonine dehydrogenase-like Zn-dependent dehydrogenase